VDRYVDEESQSAGKELLREQMAGLKRLMGNSSAWVNEHDRAQALCTLHLDADRNDAQHIRLFARGWRKPYGGQLPPAAGPVSGLGRRSLHVLGEHCQPLTVEESK
jgi:hypothetical protein